MVLGEIVAGFSIWDRVSRWWKKQPEKEELIAERFLNLFESHGVHKNQIPRFFGHDLSISDMQNLDQLTLKLTEAALDDACELFNANRSWMDGASDKIYPTYNFYKQPAAFKDFVLSLTGDKEDNVFYAFLLVPRKCEYPDEALLVVQERVGDVGDNEISRFYLCNDWSFCYWKARADLTACLAILAKQGIYTKGVYVDGDYLDEIEDGERLLFWGGEGAWKVEGERWDAEDMVYLPDLYLQGLNHRDGYSDPSALSRWLDLCDKGFMSTKTFPEPCRDVFTERLVRLRAE